MSAAEREGTISEPMTWEEICARYPAHHVFVVEMDYPWPGAFDFRTARVIGAAVEPMDAWEQAKVWTDRYELTGLFFTGKSVGPRRLPRYEVTDEVGDHLRPRRRAYPR